MESKTSESNSVCTWLPESAHPAAENLSTWEGSLRPKILDHFRREIYGVPPTTEYELSWTPLKHGTLYENQTFREFILTLNGLYGELNACVLVALPAGKKGVPAFVGLNFQGNHTISSSPDLTAPDPRGCLGAGGSIYYESNTDGTLRVPERGAFAHRWPVERITGRGFAVVTACYLQFGPDQGSPPEQATEEHARIFSEGLHPILSRSRGDDRSQSEWGSISIWAWVISRLMDALKAGIVPEIDPERVFGVGHSRLGKAALWAVAQDERFSGVLSNNSGSMGAALSRAVGETPELLARVRPFWFAKSFGERIRNRQALAVDQYQLLSCVAPRLLHVSSASDDHAADPVGEFLSWRAATSIWGLYGQDYSVGSMPYPNEVVASKSRCLTYHLREGEHDLHKIDWEHFLDSTSSCNKLSIRPQYER